MDPEEVKKELDRDDPMVIVDDPRLAAWTLGRKQVRVWHPPKTVEMHRRFASAAGISQESLSCIDAETFLRKSMTIPSEERTYEWVIERAKVIDDYGQCERANVDLLFSVFEDRTFSGDWRTHSVDGAAAVRAIANHPPDGFDEWMAEHLFAVDNRLSAVKGGAFIESPSSHVDWRLKGVLIAVLGDIHTGESKQTLLRYLGLSQEEAHELGPVLKNEAASALLKHELTEEELRMLLTNQTGDIRGTSMLYIHDYGTDEQRAMLYELHPWMKELPSIQEWVNE